MLYGKCKTGPLHTQQPRSFIFIRLRPVHPAVAGGQLADLLLELFGQLGLFQPPAPVLAHGGGFVDAGRVVQPQPVLHGNDGITPPREEDCVEIDALNDAYEETLKALFTAPDRPTAMLVSDDILAVVLEQFCGKLGLRVPKDLSIVSFNNSLFSRITSPQLTTVDVNPYQLGMEAASQTINHIENPNLLATKIIVPHRLIQRESCCPPPEI